ncbi:P-loop containing nucleoside triphosphate hydrolase protein, partial [Mycena leptocephala]
IFRGRQAILDKIHEFFNHDIGKQHIYVLYGLGGAGKTQIALKFINDSSLFADKFFLDASTAAAIDTGLKSIATLKNIGNTSQDALKWLANNQEDWLLFYDNADDPKIDLHRFIPQCNHGNIIITSRNPSLRGYAGAHFAVSDMEESDAVELLLKSAGQDISSAGENIAAEIVKELCYLPLAIVQAGAFILQSGALDSYLDIYMKNRAQLLSEKPAQSHDNYAQTVYTTWQMSFDKLSPPAAKFLQLCSFLHRDGISEDIFSRAAAYRFPSYGEWNTLHFLKVTNEIKAYSLMSFDPERKMFSIHPLVHSWSQTTIQDHNSYHSIMASIMGMSIAEISTEHPELASLRLLSHVDSLRHGNQQAVVDFGAQYGMIYYHAGRSEEAKELDLAVLEKRKQVLGDDHLDTLRAMGNLASTYNRLGKFEQAEELGVVVLEKRKQVLGDAHPDTLQAMANLASTYSKPGKFHKAEELEAVVLEKQRQAFGDDHPDTLRAMGNLALIYHGLGQFQKAEELEVVVLEKWRQAFGDAHPDTLRSMGRLASTYRSLGKFNKAEVLEVVVLAKQKQVLGDDHPDTLRAMENLASTYNCLGEFHKAEELEVDVLEKRKQVLGDDHPNTLLAMGNLASAYHGLGNFHKAEELKVIVLEKRKHILGDNHPDTLWTMGSLAATYNCLGKFQQAEELEVVVLEKRKQILGDDHPDTLWTMGNLGWTYHQLGQFQKAEELQVIALEKSKVFLGVNHPDTLQTMWNLASTYQCLGKLSEAEELETLVHDHDEALEGSEGSDEEGGI